MSCPVREREIATENNDATMPSQHDCIVRVYASLYLGIPYG